MGTTILFVMGIVPLLHGTWLLLGNSKGWYFARHSRAGGVYAEIPWGIAFLLLTLSTLINPETARTFFIVEIALGIGVMGIIFSFVQPSFLKPRWLKWLETNHRAIMSILIKDAHKMGLDVWQNKIKTQEDLEIWVVEVRRERGLE